MRTVVFIPNFGLLQIDYLKRVVDEFSSFTPPFKVDINIVSNVPLPMISGAKTVEIAHLDDWWLLPLCARRLLWEKRKDPYDLFIFNENDHLITQLAVESFLDVTKVLPEPFITGFFQYEIHDGNRYYPAYHGKYGWDIHSPIRFGNRVFAHFSNCHQAGFILTKDHLLKAIQRFDFRINNNLSAYRTADRVGADIYDLAGFYKLSCISPFNDFLIHHLPNKYCSASVNDERMRSEIDQLISMAIDGSDPALLFRYISGIRVKILLRRLLYLPGIPGKIRREFEHFFNYFKH